MKDPTNQFEQTQQAGIIFLALVRKCDDASANFQKIKNKKLWEERQRKRDEMRQAIKLNPKIIS